MIHVEIFITFELTTNFQMVQDMCLYVLIYVCVTTLSGRDKEIMAKC